MIPLILSVATLIALAWWWWRHAGKRGRSPAARARPAGRPAGNFHCVEIRHLDDACDAVKRFGDKRFLPGEAPEIPVAGCDAVTCSCRYVHHEDRRHGDRRTPFPMRASGPPSATGERRIKRDRRRPAKTTGRKSGP